MEIIQLLMSERMMSFLSHPALLIAPVLEMRLTIRREPMNEAMHRPYGTVCHLDRKI